MSQLSFRFEEFELDTESCELRRSGHHVKLERIPLLLLTLLLENPGKLVRRETIIERLWGGNVFVEAEHSINTAVNKLRAILRDDSRNPRFIRTVVGQGYCFIARVSALQPMQSSPVIATSVLAADPKEAIAQVASTAGNGHKVSRSAKEEPGAAVGSFGTVETVEDEPPLLNAAAVTIKKPAHSRMWGIAGLVGLLAALLIAVAVMYLPRREGKIQPGSEASALHSLAVLPFRNLAQTSDQDYLVAGMTDQLITSLARSTSLRVISRTSVMQYKEVQKPIQEIAQALNVDAIVEGSYLHAGKQVRITAQLIDARNDRHLWAQTYDESDKDLLAMQDQVTNDIAQQVAIALGSGFTRSKKSASVNSRARDAFLRGSYFLNERTPSSIANSVRFYTEAVRDDPNYADAYAALAKAYILRGVYGDPDPSANLWKAQYAAERALELDSSLGEAHTALGAVKIERDWDWAGGETEYLRALQLNPSDPTAHHWYSLHLSRIGKTREAEAEIQRAIALDPLSLMINTDAALTAYWARNPHEAMIRIEGVLSLNPDFAEAHLAKGKILEQLHQYKEAIAEFDAAKKLFGGAANVDTFRAHAMALAGQNEDAQKLMKQLETAQRQNHVSGADMAMAYCGLRQTDQAMKWLDIAYQRHEKGLAMIGIDPELDECRADARFTGVLSRLRLAP